ncbi:phosphatase [Caproiciproducens sp. NJN-50]|uniref:phosphatase n=1 Tax=Acutalibacteraceae TaxID=3082771 RepID=UPI000FFE0D26|nr:MULTISPECIES: phosphatase [Acutalibacteraceae]QAT49285.1 phosphatase [Caproiciproducens sp. NJN-50]
MNLIADTHTHTIASTHAYCTLTEMVHAAAGRGLFAIAVTDHGPDMPGAPGRWYFHNLKAVPRRLENVLVLRGEETNVIDFEGRTDLTREDASCLDWVVASIHEVTMRDKAPTEEKVTKAWLAIAENPLVRVIGHSGSELYRYDYERVLPVFAQNGKLVELNEASFTGRTESIPNCTRIMRLCKKHGVPIIVNSDAHFSSQVGCFERSLQLLEEIDFPEELVVNSSVQRFSAYLKQYTGAFSNSD